ncbi:hypothetical protein M422DRAFT_777214 [Sphaerobolus stellatus SS14]|nr:hypothetical protein M422DRAFT_777214 [Sphaerobolus stellatus SS14]
MLEPMRLSQLRVVPPPSTAYALSTAYRKRTLPQSPPNTATLQVSDPTFDPVLGIFTGGLAFYLNQINPRTTAPPPGETLPELLRWKRDKMLKEQEAKDEPIDAVLIEVLNEDKKP